MIRTNLAEPSVIGGLILFPDETAGAYEKIAPEFFLSSELREIFLVCKELSLSGIKPDVVQLEAKLGTEYRRVLVRCCEVMPSLSGFESYVALVRESWRKRELVRELEELVLDCQSPGVASKCIADRLAAASERQRMLEDAVRQETARSFMDCLVEFYLDLQTEDSALKTAWKDLDLLTGGLQRKGVYVIAARSGKGKTDLAINLAMRLSKDYKVNYNSMEMPRKQLMQRIISKATRINSARLRDKKNLSAEEFVSINRATQLLTDKTQLILDEQQGIDAAEVEMKILRYRPDVVFIDHLGLMRHDSGKKNQWEAIGETTGFLKQLAMKYDIVIVELVQLNREAERRSGSPKMSELKGSSDIENDADGIFILTAETDGRIIAGNEFLNAELHVVKNRHGGTGKLEFNWYPQYHLWIPLERAEP